MSLSPSCSARQSIPYQILPLTVRLKSLLTTLTSSLGHGVSQPLDRSTPLAPGILARLACGLKSSIRAALPPAPAATIKLLLWGAKRAGKTSILYRWKLETYIPTVPTIGLLEETFVHDSPLRHAAGGFQPKPCRIEVAEVGRDPLTVEMRASCALRVRNSSEGLTYDAVSCDRTRDDTGFDFYDEETDEEDDSKRHKRKRSSKRSSFRSAAVRCCRNCCLRCLKRRQRATDYAAQAWTRIIQKTNAIVYVIDSSSRSSLVEMFDDINFILSTESSPLRVARIAILANKQDVAGAVTPKEVLRMLDLPPASESRLRVFGTSALTGQNVEECLTWLEDEITAPQNIQLGPPQAKSPRSDPPPTLIGGPVRRSV